MPSWLARTLTLTVTLVACLVAASTPHEQLPTIVRGPSASASTIRVNAATRQFVDAAGRARLFHGLNAVYKPPPFVPVNGCDWGFVGGGEGQSKTIT